jgi:hypothetical protein
MAGQYDYMLVVRLAALTITGASIRTSSPACPA